MWQLPALPLGKTQQQSQTVLVGIELERSGGYKEE
jgi:hypothetical protein